MKKTLLFLLPFLVLHLFATAQNEPIVYKDFENGVKQFTRSFSFNDHVGISQINTDNEKFDLIAINDKMEVLWKINLPGYAMATMKVGDKIAAIAVTDYTFFKGKNSTYKGYIVNPADGKVITEKILYQGSTEFMEFPALFAGTASTFKLGVRQTAVVRKVHTPLPGPLALFSVNSYSKQYKETKELTVIDFNDRLEPVNTLKPKIYDAPLIGLEANLQGDVFVSWLNNGHITVDKYAAGKALSSGQITTELELSETGGFNTNIKFFPSASNSNVVFYSLMYRNSEKNNELGLGKMDFSNGKKEFITEAFSKDHIKGLEKAFVRVNTKMNKADLGGSHALDVRYLAETNGKLLVAISGQEIYVGTGASAVTESSLLINAYDTNLQLKFQQFLPAQYHYIGRSLPVGYYFSKDKFYVIANDKRGMATLNGLYGALDLTTGKWDKMEWLSKKKIYSFDFSDGSNALWFADGFILPYCDTKGLMRDKLDVTLQKNTY